MDGGTEWDVVQSWLEMADREDLLALLAYLGVDMGSLTPEELVTELYWTMERLPNSLVRAYRRYMGKASYPILLRQWDVKYRNRVDISTLSLGSDGGSRYPDSADGSREQGSGSTSVAGASGVLAGSDAAGAASQQSLDGSSVVVGEHGAEGSVPFVQRAILRARPGFHQRDDADDGTNGGGNADGEFVHVDATDGADGSAPIPVIAGAMVAPEGSAGDGGISPLPGGGRQPDGSGGVESYGSEHHGGEGPRSGVHQSADEARDQRIRDFETRADERAHAEFTRQAERAQQAYIEETRAARASGDDGGRPSSLGSVDGAMLREAVAALADATAVAHQQRAELDTLRGTVQELSDPDKQYQRLRDVALDPAWRAVAGLGKHKLSEKQIRELRSYQLTDEVITKLEEHGILPEGWPDPKRLFGKAAFREHLPREQQLPMAPMQRELLKQEIPFPENFPDRDTSYSRVEPAEFNVLSAKAKETLRKENDRIQDALSELKNLMYVGAVLADESRSGEERCKIALEFFRVQATFIWDDVAYAEKAKLRIAKLNLTGGVVVADDRDKDGPVLLGGAESDERKAIKMQNDTLAAVNNAWTQVAARKRATAAGGGGGGEATATAKAKAAKAKADAEATAKRKREAGSAKGKVGKGKDTGAARDHAKDKCHYCKETGHIANDCPKEKADIKSGKVKPHSQRAKSDKVDGNTRSASPSHERAGYVAGAAKDPPADQSGRGASERNARNVSRTEGGQ